MLFANRMLSRYYAVMRISFLEFTAYRADILFEFLTSPIIFIGYYFFFHAVSQHNIVKLGYSFQEIITYYALGWLLRMVLNQGIDSEISNSVITGKIAIELLRPIDYHYMMFYKSVGKGLARIIFYCIPGIAVLGVLVQNLNFALTNNIIFLLFFLIAFYIYYEIQFFIGCLSFYITVNVQITWMVEMLLRLMSGLVVPLNLFPPAVFAWLGYLPFQFIYFLPLKFFIQPPDLAMGLRYFFIGVIWMILLNLLNKWLFSRSVAKLTINGG